MGRYLACLAKYPPHVNKVQWYLLYIGPIEPFSGMASYCAYEKSHRPIYVKALPVQQMMCLVTLETLPPQ